MRGEVWREVAVALKEDRPSRGNQSRQQERSRTGGGGGGGDGWCTAGVREARMRSAENVTMVGWAREAEPGGDDRCDEQMWRNTETPHD